MTEFHVDHIKELKDLEELKQWSKPCSSLQEQLIQSINYYNNILNLLTIIKNNLQFDSFIEISLLNLQDLDNHINKLINIRSIEEFIQDIHLNSQDQFLKVEYWCKNINSFQKNKQNYYNEPNIQSDEKQSIITDIKQVNQNETDSNSPSKINENNEPRIRNSEFQRPNLQKIQNSQIRAQSSNNPSKQSKIIIQQITDQKDTSKQIGFRFSQTLKFERIKLTNEGKIATGCGGFVLCEPSIPKEGKSSFKIRIDKCDQIYIGVCNKYYQQAYQFEPILQQFDKHGSYLINNLGQVYCCKDEKLNNVQKSFKFQSYDVICMIVDYVSKCIEWKQEIKKSMFYKMNFDSNEELYVCVKFQKKNFSNASSVEIVSYELNK
ncbi:unnamed protein product [Paramecium sonneborni]|uniref:Uncharacterized protein n=1 Tax=Paramecium sonneborni TaxID=65129 RepID=A0A8S1PAH6_9CILI|nr:unnamed protein product [Paramecium sonneborni]